MSTLYLKTGSDLIKTIISTLKKTYSGKNFSDLEAFVKYFYEFSSADKLKTYTSQELSQIVLNSYEFFKTREKGTPKIRISHGTKKERKWERQYTIIELVNDDMPFLVDSLSEEINRAGLTIYYLTHPVIEAKRDKKGVLTELSSAAKTKNNQNVESLIHFQVSYIADKKQQEKLLEKILKVLHAVRSSVEDWPHILQKNKELSASIQTSLPSLFQPADTKAYQIFQEDLQELTEFLEWLENNNFVFLGYVEQTISKGKFQDVPKSKLGLFKLDQLWLPTIQDTSLEPDNILNVIHITKSSEKSLVHRSAHMDLISVLKLDEKGKVVGVHHLLGMFTSIVYYQSARTIPLLRRKIELIQRKSGFSSRGHSSKALAAILEDFPRDELFQTPVSELFQVAMEIVTLTSMTPRVRLFIRKDESERFISCLVFLPRDRLTTALRHKFEALLAEKLHGTVSNHYTQVAESHLARLQIIIKTKPGHIPVYNVTEMENLLQHSARLWSENLQEEIEKRQDSTTADFEAFKDAFSVSYMNRFSAEDAYYDIRKIKEVIEKGAITFDLYEASQETDPEIFHFKIYSPISQVPLSRVMPMFEHMGIHAIDEHTYQVNPKTTPHNIWIHRFRFRIIGVTRPNLKEIKRHFEEAIEQLWNGAIENDGLNKLIIYAHLNWREVVLLRSYIKYLQQVRFPYTQQYIQEALGLHPRIVRNLVKLFYVRFDPEFKGKREKQVADIIHEIETILGQVSNLAEDRILRAMLELIMATWRSNYFQKDEKGQFKSYLSFKLNSKSISFLPKPRPYAEIYVYSARVAGIHLRGGKVARGGLRWSDRHEDFRTEVLGLMKAQMTKNAVIIPVGSKGGFVVKQMPKEGGREAMLQEGIECYKTFLRGLLDLTDNRVERNIVPPKDVVRYDEDDPYLVVAADKGTATFSDIANSVSAEYHFWLGDAFASGGSVGYDHKKMGITARGAWISVQRHFREMGINVQKDSVSIIGIGDMAGDVFGNGLLRSQSVKLVAAFNHMHIFLDPDPDAKQSFKERKRLFALPRSTWLDYDAKLISKGGGIFERSAKSIKLTPQIKNLLGITQDQLTPDELIRAILLAPVDLLWNGGIGTYVKSLSETHEMVGDKANDGLRVNGHDLRVKVIGEGGNLGFTQLGRIEYALNGGRINTDAVDNSAGVDCSDHEVNIKIALDNAVRRKELKPADRDILLEEMTDEVAELVLRDNYLQTQFLTIAEKQGVALLDSHARAITTLEATGLLDREIEFLPSKEEITRRRTQGRGLTRPELSVIMAYSKLELYDEILRSKLPDDSYYNGDLDFYFPQQLQKQFSKEIHHHPLRREIIATCVTNSIVNRIGIELYMLLKESSGMEGCDIARAYTIIRDVYGLRHLWQDIEKVGDTISVDSQVALFLEVRKLVERGIFWLLKHFSDLNHVTKIVSRFEPGMKALYGCLPDVLSKQARENYEAKLVDYKRQQVTDELAELMAGIGFMQSGLGIIEVATATKCKLNHVAKIYYTLGEVLQLDWLHHQLDHFVAQSYWQETSIKTLINELSEQQKRLTQDVIEKQDCVTKFTANAVEKWQEDYQRQIKRYLQFIADIKVQDEIDFSMILVAIGKVKEIS